MPLSLTTLKSVICKKKHGQQFAQSHLRKMFYLSNTYMQNMLYIIYK